MEKEKKKKSGFLRITARILLGFLVFVILLLLFVRSPWGQGIIVDRVTSYVSGKTNTRVEIKRLFITFSGNLFLDGLYLEDTKGDTLIYSRELEVDIPLLPLIRGKDIAINRVDWSGLRANVIRKDSLEGFNFQFLIDAFAGEDTTATETPDTTATGPEIHLGKIGFKDFDLVYKDGVSGMDTRLKLGSLFLKMKEIDLNGMKFHIVEARIGNTDIRYLQNMPFPETEEPEDTETTMPQVVVDNFEIEALTADYRSVPDGIFAQADIGSFGMKIPEANLTENSIKADYIRLKNSDILLKTISEIEEPKDTVNQNIKEKQNNTPFEWPDWVIRIDEIDLENNNITYSVNDTKPETGIFNPDAISLNGLFFTAEDIFLEDRSAGLRLETFRFREASGLDLKEFALEAKADDHDITVSGLQLRWNENRIQGDVSLKYTTINDLIEKPEKTGITLSLPDFVLATEDIFYFQPDLKDNEYLLALGKNKLRGNINTKGTLTSLQIPSTDLHWGETAINIKGTLENPMEPDSLRFDLPEIGFSTIRKDILAFVSEEELGLSFPDSLALTGSANGSIQDIAAALDLRTTDGGIILAGNFANKEEMAFEADVEVKELRLEKLLKNEQLGPLSFTLKTSVKMRNINSLDAVMDANISRFVTESYTVENLPLTGEIKNGEGTIISAYRDKNIDMVLEAFVQLDSVSPRLVADLDLKGADLQALGLMQQSVKTALKLHADFKGNVESFTLTSNISDGVAVYDEDPYTLGDLTIEALADTDTTSVEVRNKMLDLDLYSNTGPARIGEALQRHFRSILTEGRDTVAVVEDSLQNNVPAKPAELKLKARMNSAPILSDVFLAGLQELDTVKLQVDFRGQDRYLVADIQMPYANYEGNEIDSLLLRVDSQNGKLSGHFGFKGVNAGPVAIENTSLDGRVSNNKLYLDFNTFHQVEKLVGIQTEISRKEDTLHIHINPSQFILNKEQWAIPPSNEILAHKNIVEFRDFRLERNGQQLEISSEIAENESEKDHISVQFGNFGLDTFLSYLNPDEPLANGNLNGNIVAEDPFGTPGFLADLQIEDLQVLKAALGTLSLDAKSSGGENYDFGLALKGGDVDLDLTGNYQASETGTLQLDLDLNELKTSLAEAFSDGEITDPEGYISGRMQVSGTTAEPVYDGDFRFNGVRFRVAMLNTRFGLPGESLKIDNSGLYLDNFTVTDENNNKFTVDGQVMTENTLNPTFDLQFKTKNFQVLNAAREDNDLFYGKAFFDVDAKLTGDLNLPKVEMKLNIGPETDVTYILPESELDIEERDGVVIFVNREDPDDVLTRAREESVTLSGFELYSLISLDKNAVFNVIINEQTNDNLQISGETDLSFNIYPNGRATLSGKYVVSKGHYELNLYNMVRRRFEITEGSSITWAGDPMDADLDMKAMYELKAAASPLMASQLTGADASVSGKFRQQLPFLVYLNIAGQLTQPQLSFNLDMPEDDQGAIGGQVYSRVQQLNGQEEELNKQVFSLLVFKRFFPESGSDGSSGGAASIARDNLNQALSGQLNALSDKLLGESGVELNFGLDSYTDYQGSSPQERTQLDITAQKKLFNDRVIVSVGSEVDIQGSNQEPGQASPLIGNVSIEYLLTQDGRYRLKGFRKNEYENVIDGQLIVSGIALIFTREFNKYKKLFEKAIREEEEETNNKKEKNEN